MFPMDLLKVLQFERENVSNALGVSRCGLAMD